MLNTPSVITIAFDMLTVFFEHALQVAGIAMGVANDLSTREAAAVDDAGMVKLVRDDGVILAHQRRDGGDVGIEAGLKSDGGFNTLEGGHAALKLQCRSMVRQSSAQQPGQGHTAPCLPRGLQDARVIGKPEVIVRAKIQHAFAIPISQAPCGELSVRMRLYSPASFKPCSSFQSIPVCLTYCVLAVCLFFSLWLLANA